MGHNMIVNLYADRMSAHPAMTSDDVWYNVRAHDGEYRDAARKLGLSAGDYAAFRRALLDGDATYVRLPREVDGMAGDHRGSVYVVRHARMTTTEYGWRVALADGKTVYVPAVCQNLSVVSAPVVAHRARPVPVAYLPTYHHRFVPPAPVPVNVVEVVPPAAAAPAPPPPSYASAAPLVAYPANTANYTPVLGFGLPILGGIIYEVSHLGGPPVAPPPCSGGSNGFYACRK